MQIEIKPVTKEEQERYGKFNRIRIGGLSADIRAYALSVEEVDVPDPLTRQPVREKRVWLWYLDIVSQSREAVKAIWAGLVNSPPKPAVLSRFEAAGTAEETDESENTEAPGSAWAYLADNARSGGFRFRYAALPKASAHQGVLVPQIALYRPTSNIGVTTYEPEADKTPNAATETENGVVNVPPEPQPEFLLLNLGEAATEAADIEQRLKEAYYRQVDALSPVPLAPQWADWLWNYAHNAGLVQILISTGCNAWLCRPPQNKDLAAALKIALEQKELETL